MPPNNTNSPKTNKEVEISFVLKERCPVKCHSKKELSFGKIQANGIGYSKSQTNVKMEDQKGGGPQRNRSVCSLVDELLCDIYSKMEMKRRTSATTCDLSWQDSDCSRRPRGELRPSRYWESKDLVFLKAKKIHLEKLLAEEGNNLIKHLKRKNFLLMRREAHYDVITAYIQAVSTKTREDTKMKFSLTPGAETGFSQWLDAMKMVAQLPGGMPSEFRTKLWLQLSEKHLSDQNVDWEKAEAVIFNEWTNPDDEELGVQIVKDLHRTGCSLFCGEQEHNQALLKRVLLAYARWNKNVGYCQGFNMLAALILQVMDKDERNAVKVMIYLIEGVLPESYFANNLGGLSVDMAVFRDLLRLRLPKLSKHLEALQHDTNAGTSYEPPLTNVFTMQWFLTLFSNCLPQQTVLRVWDLVFLYGNEILLRTALAIWGILQDRVITVESADEFYSIMGVVTREMLEFGLMDANTLIKMIAMVDPFPNELQELRDKYLYNISPWTQSVQSVAKKGIRLFYSDPDDQDDTEDEDKIALATAYGVFRRRESTSKELQVSGPTLDISVLKQQYAKLRQRQRQAHVIITAACSSNVNLTAGPSVSVNHLLMGKSALLNKGRRIGPPEGSIPPPSNKKGDDKEEKKPKIVISGETFHWKDAEKRMVSKSKNKIKSNKKVIQENEKNRLKVEEEESRLKTNHDRMEEASEISVEESLRKKAESNCSSNSSTSTELCDDEFHRYTDFDSDDATPSDSSGYNIGGTSFKPFKLSESPPSFLENSKLVANSGCDNDNLKEIKNLAINLVNEIEEEIQTSDKLIKAPVPEEEKRRLRNPKESPFNVTNGNFDNTKLTFLDNDIQILCDNILKPEPEVPTCDFVIKEIKMVVTKPKRKEGFEREKCRRKSDFGLSIIRENLEMLSKFSQKNSEKTESTSFEVPKTPHENKIEDVMCFNEKMKTKSEEIKELILPVFTDTDLDLIREKLTLKKKPDFKDSVQTFLKTDAQEPVGTIKNFFVEKAISPMVEKSPKTIKINKEVNTELTFGVEEVEISTKQSKIQKESEPAFKDDTFRDEKEINIPTTSRKSRETIFREKDEIKQRIETSKSDWELKMRKIAELETTTRETLNEIQARSIHRKSLHRSLDRSTKRTYLDEFKLSSPEKSFVSKIQLESSDSDEGESSHRKLKISALSFDEITSRTEKLLGKKDFNRSTAETVYKRNLSPEFDTWKSKDSNSKFKELIEENHRESSKINTKTSLKKYEFFSSPTSPDYRSRSNIRHSEYLSPKKYFEEFKDKNEEIQNDSKTAVGLFERKYSPERRKPYVESSRANFNPFPTRSISRPKELGVKLGLYPTSSEAQSKKS